MSEKCKKFCNGLTIILAPNLKKFREYSKLSQAELSLKIGKTKNYIKNLEELKYKRLPELPIMVEIAIILNKEINDLIPREEAK